MAESAEQAKKGSVLFTVIKIVVSLGLLTLLVVLADVQAIAQALASFSWPWVIVALALIAVSVVVSALKWGVLLKGQGLQAGFGRLFGTYSTALFFNNFLPSSIGGDGVRILLLGRSTGASAAVAASVVVERAIATASLGLLGVVAALFSAKPSALAIGLLSVIALLGLGLTVLLISGWLPRRVREGTGKIARFLVGFSQSAATLRQRVSSLWVCFALSIVFQVFVALVVAAVMAGSASNFPGLADVIYITSASSVLAMVPLGLNGYGLREGAFIYLLAPYGTNAATALTISVLFALLVSLYSLVGAFYWVADKRKQSAAAKAQSSLAPDLSPAQVERA